MKNIIPLISLLASVYLAGAQTPPAIVVTGVISLLGDRRVVLKTDPGTAVEKDFMLAEGESRLGIRLVSVDIRLATATFDNQGVRQQISICATPNLVTPEAAVESQPAAGSAAGDLAISSTSSSSAVARPVEQAGLFQNGMLVGPGSRQPQAEATPGSAPSDSATASNSGNSNQTGKQSDAWWYTGAQEMEAARLATAAAVRRGEAEPFPLTPLTPAGTPAELISAEQRYFNHFTPQF